MKKAAFVTLSLLLAAIVSIFIWHRRGGYTFDIVAETFAPPLANLTHLNRAPDIEPQSKLARPPAVIKAAYATSWSVGNAKKSAYIAELLHNTELNAIVIDLKDFTGVVSYETNVPEVKKYNAEEKRIPRINTLIKSLHDAGIYVIGRVAVFEDQKLPLARPELALRSAKTGKQWKNSKGLMWMDTASKEVWDYNIAIAKDALARGFDEINFDYIRFASDGDLKDIRYPVWDTTTPKRDVVKRFFAYVREQLPDAKISADLFGMTTTNKDDLNIGQYLEDALPYFDAIAPMVYPSHYRSGFIGIENPANAPYEVVRYSLDEAIKRIKAYEFSRNEAERQNQLAQASAMFMPVPPPARARLRPWIQDFNLGAMYDAEKVQAQIRATTDAALECAWTIPADAPARANSGQTKPPPCDGKIHPEAIDGRFVDGWMLWNPSNVYTEEALQAE